MNEHGSRPVSDDELVPRSLVERLLAPEDPFSTEPEQATIFVGRLPEGLPVEIPIPDGFEVLGGWTRGGGRGGEEEIEIVLDAAMPAGEAVDAFRTRTSAGGWSEPEQPGMGHGGFGSRPLGETALFCRTERGPALFVRARDRRNAPTSVRLMLVTGTRHSPCSPRSRGPHFESVIPDLSPPPGSRVLPQGGGGSDDDAHSTATLETDLDPAAIGAHYDAQLEEAGWNRLDGGSGGPQTWSSWTFTNEGQRWAVLFLVLRLPETPLQYLLQVHANWVGP